MIKEGWWYCFEGCFEVTYGSFEWLNYFTKKEKIKIQYSNRGVEDVTRKTFVLWFDIKFICQVCALNI